MSNDKDFDEILDRFGFTSLAGFNIGYSKAISNYLKKFLSVMEEFENDYTQRIYTTTKGVYNKDNVKTGEVKTNRNARILEASILTALETQTPIYSFQGLRNRVKFIIRLNTAYKNAMGQINKVKYSDLLGGNG
jgi:hypothetical protein